MTTETLSPELINARIEYLVTQEHRLRTTPSSDPDEILGEDALKEITQEKRRLAKQLIAHRDMAQQQRMTKAKAKAKERDEALAKIATLAKGMDAKVRAFKEFADFYNEILGLTAQAQSSNIHVGTVDSSESKDLTFLTTDRLERLLRAACIHAFGAGQFIEVTRSEQVKYLEFDFEEDLGRALGSIG